jgi:ABC-type uncharacterized transport system ATPase subunit
MEGSSPPSLAPKVLELVNKFGKGWCHPQGHLLGSLRQGAHRRPWFHRFWNLYIGSAKTGVILKDVSLEVHGGELTTVLGSKGTGTCKHVWRGLVSLSRTSPWRYTGESSPPSLAPKVLELVNRLSEVGVILKDISLEIHGGELTAVLGSKGTAELLNRYGEAGDILKDVSLEVHGGELIAVLGSKGTGTLCRLGQVLRHPQRRLPGGSWRGAHRRSWLKRYRSL